MEERVLDAGHVYGDGGDVDGVGEDGAMVSKGGEMRRRYKKQQRFRRANSEA